MSSGFDSSWGVPLVALVIAIAGGLWVDFSDRAFTRKWGPDPK